MMTIKSSALKGKVVRTQVGIIGAGPAGLVLAHLLHLHGIESVILEVRSRDHVEHRIRAGVLEHGTVDLLCATGVGDRLIQQGLVHHGIELRYEQQAHRVPMSDLAEGRTITLYGQHEVVKDLIAARMEVGPLLFEAEAVGVEGLASSPAIQYRHDGADRQLQCDFIAGCDGFHGVARAAIPQQIRTTFDYSYPLGWLGILAEVAPSTDELIYAAHDRGFALHSLRSPEVSRLYIQVDPNDDIADWSDGRIWDELHVRLERNGGWTLKEGSVLEKGITAMRAFATEPMQHGRLFIAGDAAHIVPPTGAKGLNLAVADVCILADGLAAFYDSGDTTALGRYSQRCLQRVWRTLHFSNWMTAMLHRFPDEDEFERRLRFAQLHYVNTSTAAATTLAENYVGLPMESSFLN